MQTSPLGLVLLTACVAFALAGFLFTAVSWVIVCVALLSMMAYARMRFAGELAGTELLVEHEVLDKMAFAQEPVGMKVRVTNPGDGPVRAVLDDSLPDGSVLGTGDNVATMSVPPKSVRSFAYSFVPTRRGSHTVGRLVVRRTDAFGLFEHSEPAEDGQTLNVHTRKESFDTARKIAGREHFEYSGMSKTPAVVLRAFEFDGLREHLPGDKTRDVYWKELSKTGRLMTKVYKKEGTLKTMIFVDCSRSMRLATSGMAKLDHAVDLGLQLSNVLLSSFHPAGVATYDEVSVTGQAKPALGRHQFERITKVLRATPGATVTEETEPSAAGPAPDNRGGNGNGSRHDDGAAFLDAVKAVRFDGGRKAAGLGLEGIARDIIAHSKGQELLFIIVSDLISSRDAVIATAKLCQRTGNRLLVIQTYEDWYASPSKDLDVREGERLYGRLSEGVKLEAALRRAGATFLRVGPADTTARIVRNVRRGIA